ncbi:glycosyltransferase [Actinoplanes sp. NPDC051411]|uniref:glycosyltransferase n=1 Tax=Actinoplanes sp. NPDC051411 TaxID=3155522 RepID=UPI003445EF18
MRDLAVIVPARNEERLLPGLLAALAAQQDPRFTVVLVDNASTDRTPALARTSPLDISVVSEPSRGAGTAADTGFRHAIAAGALLLARTDADCLPAPDWTAAIRRHFRSGAEMICGRSVPRRDENPGLLERHLYPAFVRTAALYGRHRHRGPGFRTPFVLVHGHNLALTADLYIRSGGTPRELLTEGSEDVTLLNRCRRATGRIVRAEDVVVESSLRRLRAWGPRRTLLWHWDRRYRPTPEEADIR